MRNPNFPSSPANKSSDFRASNGSSRQLRRLLYCTMKCTRLANGTMRWRANFYSFFLYGYLRLHVTWVLLRVLAPEMIPARLRCLSMDYVPCPEYTVPWVSLSSWTSLGEAARVLLPVTRPLYPSPTVMMMNSGITIIRIRGKFVLSVGEAIFLSYFDKTQCNTFMTSSWCSIKMSVHLRLQEIWL